LVAIFPKNGKFYILPFGWTVDEMKYEKQEREVLENYFAEQKELQK
jgi:hypothetical protein